MPNDSIKLVDMLEGGGVGIEVKDRDEKLMEEEKFVIKFVCRYLNNNLNTPDGNLDTSLISKIREKGGNFYANVTSLSQDKNLISPHSFEKEFADFLHSQNLHSNEGNLEIIKMFFEEKERESGLADSDMDHGYGVDSYTLEVIEYLSKSIRTDLFSPKNLDSYFFTTTDKEEVSNLLMSGIYLLPEELLQYQPTLDKSGKPGKHYFFVDPVDSKNYTVSALAELAVIAKDKDTLGSYAYHLLGVAKDNLKKCVLFGHQEVVTSLLEIEDEGNLVIGCDSVKFDELVGNDLNVDTSPEMQVYLPIFKIYSHLGNEYYDHFPKTQEEVLTYMNVWIGEDEDLADHYLENLKKYPDKDWKKILLSKAVSQYSVAKKFLLNSSNQDYLLINDYQEVAKIAHETIELHDNNPELDDFLPENPYFKKEKIDPNIYNKLCFLLTLYTQRYETVEPESEWPYFHQNAEKTQSGEMVTYEYKDISVTATEKEFALANEIGEHLDAYEFIRDREGEDLILRYYDTFSIDRRKNIQQAYQAIFLKWLAEMSNGNDENLSKLLTEAKSNNTEAGRVINIMTQKFESAIRFEVPLYDKVFEEFDEEHNSGRRMTEVYLGRDGLYAYLARRAQLASRGRKLSSSDRRLMKEKGDNYQIKYLVYPRVFRDQLKADAKVAYLRQEKVETVYDPVFFDTGYQGTIPEQIMRLMNFSDHEINKRIRLLSAPDSSRRIRGVDSNARNDIIELIEHNVKPENTAIGLWKDETGKIVPVASPTTPTERACFEMVKLALVQHYYYQSESSSINYSLLLNDVLD